MPHLGDSSYGDRFLTLAEYDARVGPRAKRRPSASEVLVLVMASHSLQDRVALLEHTWADVQMQRIYLVDDWLNTAPRERQWRPAVALQSPGSFGVESNYWDAQSRQLDFMRSHPSVESLASPVQPNWIMLADDDTFVHVDALLDFVGNYDPHVPALFGYVLSDAHVLGYDYPCGGAGMLLSAGAYDILAPRLLSECPLLAFNDLTLGFCSHSQGIPLVHHPGMHCAPDVNRAMRPGENLMDIQKGIAVHRLIGFQSFKELVGTLDMLKGQLRALLQHRCLLAARSGSDDDPLDSRRFFWSVPAFADAVDACRQHSPRAAHAVSLHLEFLLLGGVPVAGYHRDRHVPLLAAPASRRTRWPEWLEQLRHLDCSGKPLAWRATWGSAPQLSPLQVEASGPSLAANAQVEAIPVAKRPSWLAQVKDAARALPKSAPGHQWIFVDFSPSSTFLNVFESVRVLRSLSSLHHPGGSDKTNPYLQDVRGPVDLGAEAPPPLAVAYEYFDLNVEQAAGLWINGVAARRLLRCQPLRHPIHLDPEAHANDWPTAEERIALMWHNAIAVDVFRTLRFCGVIPLHSASMVPHALSYLPYSTYRRSHSPSVATAMSIGNVESREQMRGLSQLVTRRACAKPQPSRWKLPVQMRILGGIALRAASLARFSGGRSEARRTLFGPVPCCLSLGALLARCTSRRSCQYALKRSAGDV
ncbi:unnamed protein product, partial [Effrenium voratum]